MSGTEGWGYGMKFRGCKDLGFRIVEIEGFMASKAFRIVGIQRFMDVEILRLSDLGSFGHLTSEACRDLGIQTCN